MAGYAGSARGLKTRLQYEQLGRQEARGEARQARQEARQARQDEERRRLRSFSRQDRLQSIRREDERIARQEARQAELDIRYEDTRKQRGLTEGRTAEIHKEKMAEYKRSKAAKSAEASVAAMPFETIEGIAKYAGIQNQDVLDVLGIIKREDGGMDILDPNAPNDPQRTKSFSLMELGFMGKRFRARQKAKSEREYKEKLSKTKHLRAIDIAKMKIKPTAPKKFTAGTGDYFIQLAKNKGYDTLNFAEFSKTGKEGVSRAGKTFISAIKKYSGQGMSEDEALRLAAEHVNLPKFSANELELNDVEDELAERKGESAWYGDSTKYNKLQARQKELKKLIARKPRRRLKRKIEKVSSLGEIRRRTQGGRTIVYDANKKFLRYE